MDYDTRHDARQRLIAYAAIGIMVGVLIVSVTHTRRANARADAATTAVNSWVYASAQRNQEIEALISERDYLASRLVEALSTPDRIVTVPCVEADPTPVFSRDTQFVGRAQ